MSLDYHNVVEQIKDASAPAQIGMINLGLYTYMSEIEQQLFYSPENFFLGAAFCYFCLSVLIGFSTGRKNGNKPSPGKYQAYFISTLFLFAVCLDLVGLSFLVYVKLL